MTIEIENISYNYGKIKALNNIDFCIKEADFAVILGPNGSGKSTLLKCICNIFKVKSGIIKIDGKDINTYSHNDLSHLIAYIPQSEDSFNSMSVFDTILLGRKPYINWRPSDNDINIVANIINEFNLNDISQRHTDELSGGQRQIVMIARAIAQEPKILLLDEPTANLDLHHQMKVMELLTRLSEKSITIIATIHDLNLAARFSNNVIMLKNGCKFANGNAENIFSSQNIEPLYGVKVDILNTQENEIIIIPKKL